MNSNRLMTTLGENSRRYEQQMRQCQLELAAVREQELQLKNSLSGAFEKMADYHLSTGAKVSGKVQQLLDQRSQTESDLRHRLAQAEASVNRQLQVVATVAAELDGLVAEVNFQLQDDPQYRQQSAAYEQALAACEGANGSYLELRDECRSKLQAFQDQPLYRYLKGCGYGSEHYARGSLLRSLDRWIATLCNFANNHASEQMLLAMQEANEAASWQRDAQRAIQEAELSRLYEQALSGSLVPVLRARLEKERNEVPEGKAQANTVHERLDAFAGGRDEFFAKAAELLSRQLAEMDQSMLERLSAETPTPEDDELARQVRFWRAELNELQQRLPLLEGSFKQTESDYARAKELERELLVGGHVRSNQDYSNSMNLDGLLFQFMQGAASLAQIASVVESHRVTAQVVSHSWSTSSSSSSRHSSSSSSSSTTTTTTSSFSSSRSSGGGGFSTSDSL